jgi:poly-gamma-glutamate synthesis protein (capsule biosynthesis protein)
VAFASFDGGGDDWLEAAVHAAGPGCVLVTPHWGPNMAAAPIHRVRTAAARLRAVGASLVAGHSAHVFHGIEDRVLFDLGDFVDDYATDTRLRNDLGLFFLVELREDVPVRVAAVPIALDFCHTRLAAADERRWIEERFTAACGLLGTPVARSDGRLVVELADG